MSSDKYMRKGGMVKSMEAGDSDMAAINAIALEPLEKSDVYTFEVVACDNDIDRDFERFDEKALGQMAELFVGKTVIKDHSPRADNQFARVYAAEVEDAEGETSDGLPLKQLVAKCYTLDSEANAQTIAEIKGGIKKEVSVSFLPESVTCSICGANRRKTYCEHRWGKVYDGETCHFTLSDISDAYELSFVAIPAQRGAGTKKEYLLDGEEPSGPDEAKTEEKAARVPEGALSVSREKTLAAAFLATID